MNACTIAVSTVFIAMTAVTFALFASDKARAVKKERRIPERVLLGCSFLLGGVGGLIGMLVCRHKTKHWYFCLLVPTFAVLSTAAVVGAFFFE